MNLIDKRILSRVKESKANFLTLTYDLPSEFQKGLKDEEKDEIKYNRMQITKHMKIVGTFLNNSVYIVPVESVEGILRKFSSIYYKSMKGVSLKIVGSVFDETAKEVILKNIDTQLTDTTDKLEKFKLELESYREKTRDSDNEKVRKKLFEDWKKATNRVYKIGDTEELIRCRCEDLNILDINLSNKKREELRKMIDLRKEVLRYGYT